VPRSQSHYSSRPYHLPTFVIPESLPQFSSAVVPVHENCSAVVAAVAAVDAYTCCLMDVTWVKTVVVAVAAAASCEAVAVAVAPLYHVRVESPYVATVVTVVVAAVVVMVVDLDEVDPRDYSEAQVGS
jgi:hypothetical protein